MLVRKAKLKDIPDVVKLATEIMKYHQTLNDYWTLDKNAKSTYEKAFRKRIYSKNKLLLVAEDGGKKSRLT